jgi:hypothetical protein
LFALAYNLANLLRQLLLPKPIQGWTLTTPREKLIKIGAKVVAHARYITFQLAEVAVPRKLFARILERIARLSLACALVEVGRPDKRVREPSPGVRGAPCRPIAADAPKRCISWGGFRPRRGGQRQRFLETILAIAPSGR